MADHDYDTAESGASTTFPQQCSALRKNGHVVMKGRPCKIVEMSTSKTGKHGHAKVHLVGIDIFTSKKYDDICPSTHSMNVPRVTRIDYQLTDINDGYLSLMDESGTLRDDIKWPDDDIGKDIKQKHCSANANNESGTILITIMKAMDEEMAVAVKMGK